MISTILSLILFITFTVLGGFHFYWFIGGKWGLEKVIPTKNSDNNTTEIPRIATLAVGIGLTSFGILYLIKGGLVNVQLPDWMVVFVYRFIPVIFLLRAVGEFNYVGFFKKIKNTEFSKADSKLFSPLCLGVGIIGFIMLYLP